MEQANNKGSILYVIMAWLNYFFNVVLSVPNLQKIALLLSIVSSALYVYKHYIRNYFNK